MEEPLEWWRIAVMTGFMLALGGVWLVVSRDHVKTQIRQFMGGQGPSQKIRIVERKSLTAKTSVTLLEVEGETFLLAESAGGLAWKELSGPQGRKSEP